MTKLQPRSDSSSTRVEEDVALDDVQQFPTVEDLLRCHLLKQLAGWVGEDVQFVHQVVYTCHVLLQRRPHCMKTLLTLTTLHVFTCADCKMQRRLHRLEEAITLQGWLAIATAMSVVSSWVLSECSGVIYCHIFYDTVPSDCVTVVMPFHSFYNLAAWL